MSALSQLVDEQPEQQRAALYDELAATALRVFGVTAESVVFLGHNSGVAYRVESAGSGRLLLKVQAPQGEGEALSAPAILGGLQWLATMAEATDLPVQVPLPDPHGALLPPVRFRGLSIPCSLRRWLDGQHVHELSVGQARELGELVGRWHAFSQSQAAPTDGAVRYDSGHLFRALDDLHVLVASGTLTPDAWEEIEQATAVAGRLLDGIGTSSDVYGVVHADVNPDNVIVADDGRVQLIDLAQLAVAPYLWDLGVALYHYSYQEAPVRRALVAGYRQARAALAIPPLAWEALVCAAALDNLAFQVSIAAQRSSPLFHTNVHRFATGYCRDVVNGVPFAVE